MSGNQSAVDERLTIPEPALTRPPLKVNVFQLMRIANTALCPLFPYLDEGCFAPAVAIFSGGPGRRLSMFKHFNTVDEVMTVFGASGMRFRPGVTMADVRTHIVNIAFNNADDPGSYACLVVVQRQADRRDDQREAVTFICEKCQKPLQEFSFASCPPAGEIEQGFYTPIGAALAATAFNDSHEQRRCKHCGHDNERFPASEWGWSRYAERCSVVEAAIRAFPGNHSGLASAGEMAHA